MTIARRTLLTLVGLVVVTSTASAAPRLRTEAALERFEAFHEDADREAWQRSEWILEALALPPDAVVVDLGAGTGWMARRLARAVPEGRVLALEVEPRLVERIRRLASAEGLAHLEARVVALDDAGLEPGSVDVVVLVNVAHQLADRPRYFARLRPALRPGGRVVVIDVPPGVEAPGGPPDDERLTVPRLTEELDQAGYRLEREIAGLPRQFFALYVPVAIETPESLAREVGRALDLAPTIEEATAGVAWALGRALEAGALPASVRQPLPGLPVTTTMLHVDPESRFSIAALVLRPGAVTPLHDHGTWTVWGTLVGHDRERRYVRGPAEEGAYPLLDEAGERELLPGAVSVLPSPPGDVHRLENVGSEPSVSVHVHGADMSIQPRNAYDPSRKLVLPFVQSYERGPGGDP